MRALPLLLVSLASAVRADAASTSAADAARRYVAERKTECLHVGRPVERPGLIISVDLTGDAVVDQVIDLRRLECRGALTLWSGAHGGSPVVIFVSHPGGGAYRAYEGAAHELKVGSGRKAPRVYLVVGGGYCGQERAGLPFSDTQFCWRPLDWNAEKKTFDFASLDQAQPFAR